MGGLHRMGQRLIWRCMVTGWSQRPASTARLTRRPLNPPGQHFPLTALLFLELQCHLDKSISVAKWASTYVIAKSVPSSLPESGLTPRACMISCFIVNTANGHGGFSSSQTEI